MQANISEVHSTFWERGGEAGGDIKVDSQKHSLAIHH